jgi:hypothetical protein
VAATFVSVYAVPFRHYGHALSLVPWLYTNELVVPISPLQTGTEHDANQHYCLRGGPIDSRQLHIVKFHLRFFPNNILVFLVFVQQHGRLPDSVSGYPMGSCD